MDKQFFIDTVTSLVNSSPSNTVHIGKNSAHGIKGLRMYDEPIVGVAGAADDLFENLRASGVIGAHFKLPNEWLSDARAVISVFFPLTEMVKKSNKQDMNQPSGEWLLARYEGQQFIAEISKKVKSIMESKNYTCVVPFLHENFSTKSPLTDDKSNQDFYTSNWSERHIAYVCGLGTFGLSKGLITKKGIAGRFASFITNANIEPDTRQYTSIYGYCTMCGACVKNCPVGAISLEKGKNHPLCSDFLDETREKYNPRYGCGKCQVRVPCESRIPIRV